MSEPTRRDVVDESTDLESLEAPERTDAQVIGKTASAEISGALGELPFEQRRVIVLAYFGGFTHTVIASMPATPTGTVKGRMRLGLQTLRSRLGGGSVGVL